jgi:hypothetical protein
MVRLPLQGGCQCGALRYRVTAPPLMVYNCHCTNCQRIGGGAFSTPATLLESDFAFVAGEPRAIEWTSDAGNGRFGWFCASCGSRIAHGARPSNGILSLRTGTLDDRSWVAPVGDIWTQSAQPWVTLSSERLRFEKQPGDYTALIEAFRGLGLFAS